MLLRQIQALVEVTVELLRNLQVFQGFMNGDAVAEHAFRGDQGQLEALLDVVVHGNVHRQRRDQATDEAAHQRTRRAAQGANRCAHRSTAHAGAGQQQPLAGAGFKFFAGDLAGGEQHQVLHHVHRADGRPGNTAIGEGALEH
ncbi:hypothetical protein D3C76_1464800 [compost metagenome]